MMLSKRKIFKALLREIKEWADYHDINVDYEERRDLSQSILNLLQEMHAFASYIPEAEVDDDEYYN